MIAGSDRGAHISAMFARGDSVRESKIRGCKHLRVMQNANNRSWPPAEDTSSGSGPSLFGAIFWRGASNVATRAPPLGNWQKMLRDLGYGDSG